MSFVLNWTVTMQARSAQPKLRLTPEERAQWGRQVEFVLTLIGYAVGLGNVWRFPYLCYRNGGGAFLIPYVISLVFLGIPVFALEISFGQFGGLGMCAVAVAAIVMIYYGIIIAWAIRFLIASFTDHLPWEDCKSCACLLYRVNTTDLDIKLYKENNTLGLNCSNVTLPSEPNSPSELYFSDSVLGKTDSIADPGSLQWELLLCNLLVNAIVFLVLVKGIKSLGKVVYFTAVFPYILLTILLVWGDAAIQIFFSLSACNGGLIAMASYNSFHNNVIRDSFLVPIINCLTSFFAGFVVFSTLGYMAHIKGTSVGNVTAGGPGLAFVVYPEAISQMPVSPLWAILFFFMISILGFSTQSGQYLLDLIDGAELGYPLLIVGLVELIVIIALYGYENFAEDIKSMIGRKPPVYFKYCWCYISPVLLTGVIVFKAYQQTPQEPDWAELMYWLAALFPLSLMPGWWFYYVCTKSKLTAYTPAWRARRDQQSDDSFKNSDAEEIEMNVNENGTGPKTPAVVGDNTVNAGSYLNPSYVHHQEEVDVKM
nr:hypothetical protein BaRGS_024720 [Batillaria attramentaria]